MIFWDPMKLRWWENLATLSEDHWTIKSSSGGRPVRAATPVLRIQSVMPADPENVSLTFHESLICCIHLMTGYCLGIQNCLHVQLCYHLSFLFDGWLLEPIFCNLVLGRETCMPRTKEDLLKLDRHMATLEWTQWRRWYHQLEFPTCIPGFLFTWFRI